MKKGQVGLTIAILAAGVCGLGGCEHLQKAKEFTKTVEGHGYDKAAVAGSSYCKGAKFDFFGFSDKLITQERLELRREIRQRGENGPDLPQVDGLDEKTQKGNGPVIRVYCEGETVPKEVAEDFVRIRKR